MATSIGFSSAINATKSQSTDVSTSASKTGNSRNQILAVASKLLVTFGILAGGVTAGLVVVWLFARVCSCDLGIGVYTHACLLTIIEQLVLPI